MSCALCLQHPALEERCGREGGHCFRYRWRAPTWHLPVDSGRDGTRARMRCRYVSYCAWGPCLRPGLLPRLLGSYMFICFARLLLCVVGAWFVRGLLSFCVWGFTHAAIAARNRRAHRCILQLVERRGRQICTAADRKDLAMQGTTAMRRAAQALRVDGTLLIAMVAIRRWLRLACRL